MEGDIDKGQSNGRDKGKEGKEREGLKSDRGGEKEGRIR